MNSGWLSRLSDIPLYGRTNHPGWYTWKAWNPSSFSHRRYHPSRSRQTAVVAVPQTMQPESWSILSSCPLFWTALWSRQQTWIKIIGRTILHLQPSVHLLNGISTRIDQLTSSLPVVFLNKPGRWTHGSPSHQNQKPISEQTWLVVYLPLWKIWVGQLGLWNSQYINIKIWIS